MSPSHKIDIRLSCQSRFDRERFSGIKQFIYSLEHQATCFYSHAFGIERRQALGYLIGIDKFLHKQ